jgi:hypothetical protein
MVAANWIYERNTRPLLEILAVEAGYGFDDDDWLAVQCGLKDTDVEAEKWFEYPLLGRNRIIVSLARDPGAGAVFVRIDSHEAREPEFGLVLSILQHYLLSR